jgi:mono/diheme cytochrome c family protein
MKRHRAALALLALLCGACDVWYDKVPSPDDLWHIIPWFDHMIDVRYVHPYQTSRVPRYTPEGAVPITGSEPDWSAEWMAGKTTTVNALKNPYAEGGNGTPWKPGPAVPRIPHDVAATGDTLFDTFCAVCHGPAGDGKGKVGVKLGAPSLLSARARAYPDGYIYSIIRYGRGVMPRYGDKVYLPSDRWAIVNHVRKLQAQSPAPQEPASAAAPIPPAPSALGSTGARPQ